LAHHEWQLGGQITGLLLGTGGQLRRRQRTVGGLAVD
jgi:hypothetical protein